MIDVDFKQLSHFIIRYSFTICRGCDDRHNIIEFHANIYHHHRVNISTSTYVRFYTIKRYTKLNTVAHN